MTEPFYTAGWFLFSAAICFVLLVHGVYRFRWNQLTQRTTELVEELSLRTEALEEANECLKQLSLEDSLTSLLNRRAFDALLQDECRRADRSQLPLALMMLDIDYFKQFNDIYGHQSGDNCLVLIAKALKAGCGRAGDFVARYGGEEIAIILPATTMDTAMFQAESLRHKVQDLAIPHSGSDIGKVVTVSIGIVSVLPTPKMHPSELVATADRALYRAKETGRNRVEQLGIETGT
jgi:diguanylate cyclase (GGDEF)-like protein